MLSKASAEDRGPSEEPDDSFRARLRARAPTCAPEPCWKSTFSCSGSGRKPGGSGTKEVCFADKRLRAPRPEALVHHHTTSFIFLFLFPHHHTTTYYISLLTTSIFPCCICSSDVSQKKTKQCLGCVALTRCLISLAMERLEVWHDKGGPRSRSSLDSDYRLVIVANWMH